ncbi:hypothetical protein EmuJ_000498000 [Echinococcus multilocularis]|uniref:Uncharacterized protein n=1 Tax=Echinococcus multilocularis TaxID=6211 RepID=A0A068Y3J0_ECHMU|nr:hypothetical protein EmuJ_000498000 [Echinococcus multilocularis]
MLRKICTNLSGQCLCNIRQANYAVYWAFGARCLCQTWTMILYRVEVCAQAENSFRWRRICGVTTFPSSCKDDWYIGNEHACGTFMCEHLLLHSPNNTDSINSAK